MAIRNLIFPFEPNCITTIKLSLRRTLLLSYRYSAMCRQAHSIAQLSKRLPKKDSN